MISTEQLPMAFSSVDAEARGTRAVWLGLAIDHRRLFDTLQDDWLRPNGETSGHTLGVQSFALQSTVERTDSRIITCLRVDLASLPRLEVLVRRKGQWVASSISDIFVDDEAVVWPGVLPAFAISEVLVGTREEQVRLIALARQVSNVALPGSSPGLLAGERTWHSNLEMPVDLPPGLVLPPTLDATRGATTMAMWAVPRSDPWLDLLTASLAPPSKKLAQFARTVSSPWWVQVPWSHVSAMDGSGGLQEQLWSAAIQVLCNRQGPVGAAELAQEISAIASSSGTERESIFAVEWLQETIGILRAESTIRLDNWKLAPVQKAIQLVLVRPEPPSFKTWIEDLPELPPAVWWSAATLCGLLYGYRKLERQFRGDTAQRKFLLLHALRACAVTTDDSIWPTASHSAPVWRRQSGSFVFSWNGVDFARKTEQARGKWFSADMDAQHVKHAAEDMARRFQWPCLLKEIGLPDGQIELLGSGVAEIITAPSRQVVVRGGLRMRLPPEAVVEEVLDVDEFKRCVATEGVADIPAPPVLRSSANLAQRGEIPGLIYARDFLSASEEAELVAAIDQAEWMSDMQRRVQHYGWRYDYKSRQIDSSMRLGPLPAWAANLAERLFEEGLVPHVADQVIVNEYRGREGIGRHVDCVPCFADGIAMVSLLESWEMVFRDERAERKVPQLLERRSVAVMTGESRYQWSHEIPRRQTEPHGLHRVRRISVTLRKVLPSATRSRRR